jgi:hypothetical protein
VGVPAARLAGLPRCRQLPYRRCARVPRLPWRF